MNRFKSNTTGIFISPSELPIGVAKWSKQLLQTNSSCYKQEKHMLPILNVRVGHVRMLFPVEPTCQQRHQFSLTRTEDPLPPLVRGKSACIGRAQTPRPGSQSRLQHNIFVVPHCQGPVFQQPSKPVGNYRGPPQNSHIKEDLGLLWAPRHRHFVV